jgi:hypothetical protein
MALISQLPPSPASYARSITPTDGVALAQETRGIYVGVTGDLTVILTGDTVAVTFKAVPAGSLLPIAVKQVNATGTTASSLVGLY